MAKKIVISTKRKPRLTSARVKARVGQKKKPIKEMSSKKSKTAGKTKKPTRSVHKKLFTAKERRKLRDLLIRLRDRITGQIDFLAADNLNRTRDDAAVNFRSEEQGTDNYDRDFALNRVSLEQDNIFEIDEALNRIKIGTYGICENCKHPIEKARLTALPYSRMCISCQSQAEAGKTKFRSFDTSAVFPNEGKPSPPTNEDDE